MPTPVTTYQELRAQYNQLPWYKKVGFWLSAPRLAWGLFGYKQTPSESRIQQLIALAKSAWFYKTEFERAIYGFFTSQNSNTSRAIAAQNHQASAPLPPDTMKNTPGQTTYSAYMSEGTSLGRGALSEKEVDADVLGVISDFTPEMATLNAHAAASSRKAGVEQLRTRKITIALLKAVAYGMESSNPAVNTPIKPSVAAGLFNPNLFAADLLKKSPEFLLERGDVTDWAGRTFKNITAFEYAVWAKDFKMIEMMLKCIPATPDDDVIREALFEQFKQVKAPVSAGGGLTYTHTYERPNLDAAGIPDGTTTTVTEEPHTENHFDLTPLCAAYQDYETNFNARTWPQRDAYWAKLIGKLQRFLPVHVLQRYCDPDMPFYPPPQFNNAFKRSMDFYNWDTAADSSLFGSTLSSGFALYRPGGGRGGRACGLAAAAPAATTACARADSAAIRQLDEVSTNEMDKIIRQLSQPQHAAGLRP